MKNFDRFAGIDWTGARAPVKSRSIAVAVCGKGRSAPVLCPGPWSRAAVADWLERLACEGKRTLAGIDCNFGYAREVGRRQFGPSYDFHDLWRAVDAAGGDNYFAGGYWEASAQKGLFWTGGRKPPGMALPKRATEEACGRAGHGWPESPFKLHGPKQVGKGGLAGMRMVLDLKRRCGDAVAVWPFERDTDGAALVITEIYPRQFLRRSGHGAGKVRTAGGLNACLGKLGSRALRPVPEKLSDHEADALVSAAGLRFLCGDGATVPDMLACPRDMDEDAARREGWIFGAGYAA